MNANERELIKAKYCLTNRNTSKPHHKSIKKIKKQNTGKGKDM